MLARHDRAIDVGILGATRDILRPLLRRSSDLDRGREPVEIEDSLGEFVIKVDRHESHGHCETNDQPCDVGQSRSDSSLE